MPAHARIEVMNSSRPASDRSRCSTVPGPSFPTPYASHSQLPQWPVNTTIERPLRTSSSTRSIPSKVVVAVRTFSSLFDNHTISNSEVPRWRNIERATARRLAWSHSGKATDMLSIAFRRSRRATWNASEPSARPIVWPVRYGMARLTRLMPRSERSRSRSLNALSFGPATDEFLNDLVPVAALAKEALDQFAKRAAAAGGVKLPRRCVENFRRGIRRRGRDQGARHRSEVGQVVAGIEDLLERDAQFLRQALRRIELVRRTL